jgi:hypothetical protein
MHSRRQAWIKITEIVFVGALVSGLSAQISDFRPKIGIPEDWTHHHIRFSSAAIRQHPEIASREPRAALHLYREARIAALNSFQDASTTAAVSQHRDWSINLGTGRIQFGQYPAKWNADPNVAPSCTKDFVIYGLNVTGATGGQANLVGLTNLYSGGTNPLCPGAQPLFLFSFNTTTIPNGRITTSPVLSLDGKKVAFIETSTQAGAKGTVLHVLTVPTTVGTHGTSASASVAPGASMSSLTIINNNSDTRSSPWVDYASDTMYVCGDNGSLYKITGVFNGTPALAGAPWPKLVHLNSIFTSPVLDTATGNAFMGAGNGRVYVVNVNNPTTVSTIQIGTTGAPNSGVFDSPTFDATGSTIFAVTSNDTTGAAVVQASTATLLVVGRVHIGEGSTGGTSITLYDGDFDNNYFTTPSTGHMYMCGTGPAGDTSPWLYRLDFGGTGLLTASTAISHISANAAARCGPITEFFNSNIGGGTDFFFWGVTRNCVGANGCVMSMANGVVPATTPATEMGGASGIIVDNNSTAGAASSIYFSTEANILNAVKLTQQGLN